MSERYNAYLKKHIDAVVKAANWMADNLVIVDELPDDDVEQFLFNATQHDSSKYCLVEYEPYDAYFYGKKNQDTFDIAWLHHIHLNPHHWQHWLLMNDDGKYREPGKVVALEMPKIYALEMIADWWSFSWQSGDLTKMFGWYEEHKDCIVLHERTREYVERVLDDMRELI